MKNHTYAFSRFLTDPRITLLARNTVCPKMSANDPLTHAVSTNDLPALRTLLEKQDSELFAQVAKNGTAETAAYLLSRHSVPEDYSQYVPAPSPTHNPTQYLICESARYGNCDLFRYLLTEYPPFLSGANRRNLERLLVIAMVGGVDIWKIILEYKPHLKDYEFSGHQGCVLEMALRLGPHKDLLEFLLKEGADTDRAGDPVLESFRRMGAESDVLEMVRNYSK